MRDFRSLNIWSEAIQIVKEIYSDKLDFPKEEHYGLKSQISRAANSVPSNIAEGCSRSSQKEFIRFLEIALGSSFEVETQLIICKEIRLISNNNFEFLLGKIHKNQKQINALVSKLKTNG